MEDQTRYILVGIAIGILIGGLGSAIMSGIIISNKIDEFWHDNICFDIPHGHKLIGLYSYCRYESDCYSDFLNWSSGWWDYELSR